MNNKKLILAAVALVAVVAILAGVYLATQSGPAAAGAKANTVTVIHADGTEKVFTYNTDAEKLGAFLEAEGVIIGSGDGMFHTVDGEKADWSVNQSYWALYLNDEYATAGIYDTDIESGAEYKLVYTLG
jgi:hypothetical protein